MLVNLMKVSEYIARFEGGLIYWFVGLPETRQKLTTLVSEVRTKFGADKPIILGGFSQGAMTAMDLALSLDTPVNGVLMLSGIHALCSVIVAVLFLPFEKAHRLSLTNGQKS